MTTPPAGPGPLLDAARVATALAHALRPGGADLVELMAETARAVFGAGACSVALLTPDGQELEFTTVSGGAADVVSGMRIPAGQGIAGWVATTGQPLAVSDLQRDPRFLADVARSTEYMPGEILACPVATDDRLLGVIEVLDRDPGRSGSEGDMELLSLFARQAALAFEAADRSARIGSLVLRAAGEASDGGLAQALRTAADSDDGDDGLGPTAAAFAALAQRGPAERELAVEVLQAVAAYVERTSAWR